LHGFRNSQVTVLAPTGTIAFLMDCDTTGVEPETALVKYKTLAGGGMLKIVNRIVPLALQTLGYSEDQIAGIIRHIDEYDTIEDVAIGETVIPSGLKAEHLAVFDCSFPPSDQERDGYPVQPVGKRSISWLGHVRMMEACQPFLSGAISKTVNLPEDSTPDEIREAYVEGWKRGLKALAIYRDNSKASQPLSTKAAPAAAEVTPAFLAAADIETEVGLGQPARLDAHSNEIPDPWLINGSLVDPDWPVMRGLDGPVIGSLRELSELANLANQPKRERLPSTRRSMTHKFEVDGHEGYITVGMYQDGRPGEVFVKMSKEGSTIGGLMDALGIAVSVGLQYGVPLPVLVEKFAYTRFEPSGMTQNRDIPIARSVADYVFRWLGMEFLAGYHAEHAPHRDDLAAEAMAPIPAEAATGGEDLEIGDSLEQLHQTLQRTISQFHEIAIVSGSEANPQRPRIESHNPSCRSCGGPTQRTGACYTCTVCGEAGGCG
jgi:ribonucleoside-diphosphate reductase alpha chain